MDSFSLRLKFHCLYLQCILNLSFAIYRLFFQELTGKPIWNESHCQKKFWEITYVLHSRACTKEFSQWDLHFCEFRFFNLPSLQSCTGLVQGQNRVFPVKFSHTGKNLFSLQGTPVLIAGSPVFITGISLCTFPRREKPVLITWEPCNENRFFPVWEKYTGKILFWPCTGPVRDCSVGN